MKLKKPQPTQAARSTILSRTMQLALSDGPSASMQRRDIGGYTNVQWTSGVISAPHAAFPRTPVEQYWAGRAAVAETLLSARCEFSKEGTQARTVAGEPRPSWTIAAVVFSNNPRQIKLEWIVMLLVVALVYVATMAPGRLSRNKGSAAHFTVPILSPFTSVVEHETGVIGTKTMVVFVLALSGLLYIQLHRRRLW